MTGLVPFTPAEARSEVGRSLLALNNAHATELSWLSPDRFAVLVGSASWTARIGTDAFVIAFDETAAYDGGHFRWFRSRFESFLYVDRVVVDAALRGRGFGRALYRSVFETAVATRRLHVTCEVNTAPANPASASFHAGLGFETVGAGDVDGGKQVAYLARRSLAPSFSPLRRA